VIRWILRNRLTNVLYRIRNQRIHKQQILPLRWPVIAASKALPLNNPLYGVNREGSLTVFPVRSRRHLHKIERVKAPMSQKAHFLTILLLQILEDERDYGGV